MIELLYFAPISKGTFLFWNFIANVKQKPTPLAPVTIGLPASNNEIVMANVQGEHPARQIAFQELPQLILTNNPRSKDLPPSFKSYSYWESEATCPGCPQTKKVVKPVFNTWLRGHRMATGFNSSKCHPPVRKLAGQKDS